MLKEISRAREKNTWNNLESQKNDLMRKNPA